MKLQQIPFSQFFVSPVQDKAAAGVSPRYLWLAVLPALLFAMAWGTYGLGFDVIYAGEFYSVNHVGVWQTPGGLDHTLTSVATNSPQHAPAYFVLLNGWVRLVGWNVAALRALALLFMLLTVAWTYRLGRDVTGSAWVGVFGAALTAGCMHLLDFSHAVRQYTLLPLLTVVASWFYWRIMSRDGGRVRWWAWAGLYISVAGVIYTHYVGIFPLAALGVFHVVWLLNRWRREGISFARLGRWWGVVGVMALAGLSFAPWIGVLIYGLAERKDLSEKSLTVVEIIRRIVPLYSNGLPLLLWGALALTVVGLARRERGILWLWGWLVFTLGATFIAHLITPLLTFDRVRYLILILPVLALLMGAGLAQFRRWWVLPTAVIGFYLFAGAQYIHTEQYITASSAGVRTLDAPPFQRIIDALLPRATPDDYFLGVTWDEHLTDMTLHNATVSDFYLGMLDIDYQMNWAYIETPEEGEAMRRQLTEALATHDDFWLMYEPFRTAHWLALYRSVLAEARVLCEVVLDLPNARVEHYGVPGSCTPLEPNPFRTIRYLDGIAVMHDVQIDLPQTGDVALVSASWTVSDSIPPDTYSASLQLFNSAGEKVWQHDYALKTGYFDMRRADLPLTDLPPGDYELRVRVYEWRTQDAAIGTLDATGEQGDMLTAEWLRIGTP